MKTQSSQWPLKMLDYCIATGLSRFSQMTAHLTHIQTQFHGQHHCVALALVFSVKVLV